jgi:ribose transport system ATP-binding protein
MPESTEFVLKLDNIVKTFPGVKALSGVSMDFVKGEVHGIVGENGAGKSTLMKILVGVLKKDSGSIFINGQNVEIKSPLHAQQLGLSIIFQEFNLVNSLSIAENLFVGRLARKGIGRIDWKAVHRDASALLESVGLKMDPSNKIEDLSVAQKQIVEIAKALSFNSKIIIMDEPSATLTSGELKNLFSIIEKLKKNGVTVIYISHRLDEIFELCDRVTVLRDGCVIDTNPIGSLTKELIITKMVGRTIENEYPKRNGKSLKEIALEVNGLTRKGVFEDVSFVLHKGEILGLAGLVGSGRTEIVRSIYGADNFQKGTVKVNGIKMNSFSPQKAIGQNIALLTEDRKQQSLILHTSIRKNISLANLKSISKAGVLNTKKEKEVAKNQIEKLSIKTPGMEQTVVNLSGGNQQKVIIGKWLNTSTEIFILDEPTRGIDVGAKYEIYKIINNLVDAGKSVIFISSELPEVINMSDRLLVIHGGRIKGELSGNEKTAEMIMKYAILKEGER